MTTHHQTNGGNWEEFQREIQTELEQSRHALSEVSLMLEQSQAEINKLMQRNAAITAHLQQVQAQFDSLPRSDIQMAYHSALDAQQRLLVMRGQLEKLQSDQVSLQKLLHFLKKFQEIISEDNQGPAARKGGIKTGNLEMIVNAQEAERQRLSRQMHDGPAQTLSNFIVQTEIVARLFEIDPGKAKEELNNLKTAAMGAFQQVRAFIFDLRPMILDDLGLFPTLKRYVDTVKEQSGIEIMLSLKGQERRFEPYLEVMIFRALQELIGNAIHHNQDHPAKIQINLQLYQDETEIKVSIRDNGKGFSVETLGEGKGLGLKLIRERVEMLGGSMEINSTPSQGTQISFQVPCMRV